MAPTDATDRGGSTVSDSYVDRWITCTADAIEIRGYYFPWGAKRIPYDAVRSLRRVAIGALTGKWRIWGTANPRYWASLDPGRPRKDRALILDVGASVQPFITPDDPDAVERIIRDRARLPSASGAARRGPLI
jgi:hypothetical protein